MGKKHRGSGKSSRAMQLAIGIVFLGFSLYMAILAIGQGGGTQGSGAAGSAGSAGPVEPVAPVTTAWPYGQPEYRIELPPGYEDLLPGAAGSTGTHGTPGTNGTPGTGGTRSTGGAEAGGEPAAEVPGPAVATPRLPRSPGSRSIAIVIDDAGYSLPQLRPFLDLPFPLTIAVLPGVPHSAESADLIRKAGKELFLHQPMEALGGNDPGPGAILLSMTDQDIIKTLESNIDSIGPIAGINNHMGSAVTRDERIMRAVLSLVKARGLHYLDSLTTAGTVTAAAGASVSLPTLERDVFLDNSQDHQSMLDALEEGMKQARARGNAVLIGHVWSDDLARTLMEVYPRLVEEGYSLTTISRMMLSDAKGSPDARAGD